MRAKVYDTFMVMCPCLPLLCDCTGGEAAGECQGQV
jgi:hypothetical protein